MPRKTRKQKEKAKQRLESKFVKREFEFRFQPQTNKNASLNDTKKTDKSIFSKEGSGLPHGLARSLLTALILVSLELMIYFGWFK